MLEANRRAAASFSGVAFLGRSPAEPLLAARMELLDAARQWTAAYRNVPSAAPDPRGPIVMTGHQPQLVHPGVWIKNFAAGGLARRLGATAVHLIVDADLPPDASIAAPGGSLRRPETERIAFDRAEPKIPYEERKIEDRAVFADFPRRVIERIAPFVSEPLLRHFWPMVMDRAKETDNLGSCLAQARHRLEGAWGLETLEVPQSRLCAGESFQWFVASVLARLPAFRAAYNESIREYRRVHRLRSRTHPAPELAEEGEWLEAPFWIWTADDPRRRRLFARSAGAEIVLSDGEAREVRLPRKMLPKGAAPFSSDEKENDPSRGPAALGRVALFDGDARPAVERLLELAREGVRIRPRALTTTLWTRLVLCDLFLHGLGGAKYDEVVDRLIERFFGLTPPGYLVVSATLHLPVARPVEPPVDVKRIQRELRELTYHPERRLTPDQAAELASEKRRWIETPQTAVNAKERCQAIRRINAALQPWVEEERSRLETLLAESARMLQAQTILENREYAFCLFPESMLREFFESLTFPRS